MTTPDAPSNEGTAALIETGGTPPEPARKDALSRLQSFVPRAGRTYAARRNYDLGPDQRDNVSVLSPYTRHRLVTEQELVAATLQRHAPSTAEKFIQEVCWRTYWKGWLEQRPSVWTDYLDARDRDLRNLGLDGALSAAYAEAVEGRTGIACFDHWARELRETGYLHNHARMWFASIWIFTLDLPWTLGADFFYRHLYDGDPASNTLSWRWVGGLQTRGKTYLARSGNIATYTDNRFPGTQGLASTAPPLEDDLPQPSRQPLPERPVPARGTAATLLLHEDDLAPETADWIGLDVKAIVGIPADSQSHDLSQAVKRFKAQACADGLRRATSYFGVACADYFGQPAETDSEIKALTQAVLDVCRRNGTDTVVTLEAPVGPARTVVDQLDRRLATSDISLFRVRRAWDAAFWPHATAGFFKLKKQIPRVLEELGLTRT